MILNLNRLEQDEIRLVHDYADSFDLRDESLQLLRAPSIRLVVRKVGPQVRTVGHFGIELAMRCDRCLGDYRLPIETDFDLFFLPVEQSSAAGEIELTPEDMTCSFYRQDQIDVDALILEQIQLALPIRRLCREDCRGLCGRCGADLNRDACRCGPDAFDPRWSGLRDHPFSKEP